jgi:hypothetical protein
MSPEQAAGRVEHVDQQADVYALGVVLYKLLAGRHPHNLGRLDMAEALARDIAQTLQARIPASGWLGGRPIKIADGTTLSMPDTPANQKVWPQHHAQAPGLGFPILRMVAVMSLSCGVVLDVAFGPYCGKKTGETALLRQLFGHFAPGDVALVDALFANYWTIAGLLARGVDVVARRDGKRALDFRAGRRLGSKDHRVVWKRPPRPRWMSCREYRRMPRTLGIRELCVKVRQPGFRTRDLVVITTLLDDRVYRKEDIALAYRARWNGEVDLRSLKQTMGIDVLRCKTPAMVRKEIWMHLLAYNLIRTLLANAADSAGLMPRELSLKAAIQTVNAFAALGPLTRDRQTLYAAILKALATHRVGDRPDRIEPRAVKRRPKHQNRLWEPRNQWRNRLLKRG